MKNTKGFSVSLLLSILLATPVSSQNWIPDSLFGSYSSLIVNAGGSETFSNFLLQPDGKIVAGGWDSDASGYYHNIMIRFNQCGFIDSTFGANGIVKHRFDQRNKGHNYALQTDGKFLCAGIQAPGNAGSQQIPFVARYNADGSIDTNFASAGTKALRFDAVSSGTFYAVIPMNDGRILCGGTCSANANGGVHGLGVMRFMNEGSLDSSFGTDGKTRFLVNTSYMPSRARLLQNGNIIVAGRYLDGGNNSRFVAVCFDSIGVLNTTFAVAGVFTDTVNLKYIYADAYMDMQTDEKIVMACTREPASNGIEVIRFTSSGIPDITFGINGHVNLTFAGMECTGIKVLSNGKIMIMGKTNNSVGSVVQLLSGGAIDSAFATNGYLTVDLYPSGSDYVGGVLKMPNNRLLFGGGDFDHNMRRYYTQSNVPHISGDASLLQTTGSGTYQWFLNDTVIAAATSSTFIPTANGNYTVQITDDLGCNYLSEIFAVTGIGVDEYYSDGLFQIYPNPVGSELFISSQMIINYVKVFNVIGKEIFNVQLPGSSNSFKLQTINFKPGVYLIETTSGSKKSLTKFIKQ